MFSKNYVFFLDLGAYSLKGILINKNNFTIVAQDYEYNSGIINGYISNAELFVQAMELLKRKIEKSAKTKITEISLIIGGKIMHYKLLVSNEIKLHAIINGEKINFIHSKIQEWIDANNALLVKSEPIEYKIDGMHVENPLNLYANKIQFVYFLAYSNAQQLGNIAYLVERMNLNIVDISPSIYAAASIHLTKDEKTLGSLIFDFGANNINWAYYLEGKPLNAGTINLGSEIITHKIAKSLKININDARKLKHKYASCLLLPEHFCSWIEFNSHANPEFMLQSEFVRKILPEINLIANEVKKIIANFSNKAHIATFCGAGAWINNFIEFVQKSSSMTIKLTPSDNPHIDALTGAIENYKKIVNQKQKNILQRAIDWLHENL